MTRPSFKRGLIRLWIVLAVGFDLWCLVEYLSHGSGGALVAIAIITAINVAWFVALKACFWVWDGFTKESV
jgi:hypothetical protein